MSYEEIADNIRIYSPQKRTIEMAYFDIRNIYSTPKINRYFLQFPEMIFYKGFGGTYAHYSYSTLYAGFYVDGLVYRMPFSQHGGNFAVCLDDRNHFVFPDHLYNFNDLIKLFWGNRFSSSFLMNNDIGVIVGNFQSYENWQKMNLDEVKQATRGNDALTLNDFLEKGKQL